MKFSDRVARVRKAIAAALVPLVLGLCARYGLDVDVEVVELIVTAVITGGTVYAVPNEADGVN